MHTPPMTNPKQLAQRRYAAALSLGVGVVMLALKMGAWLLTGSATIFSDALESVVHVAAVGFMFWAMLLAQRPADADHPYGHGRVEHLSVGFEGGAIMVAGLAIIWEAVNGLWHNQPLPSLDLGLWLISAAMIINLGLGSWLLMVGRRTRSTILTANGQHVLSDVWTSAGVIIGVVVLRFVPDPTLRTQLDSGIAILLALVIMVAGFKLVRQAFAGLLDEADETLIGHVVSAINEVRQPDWLDIHNLRCRTVGDELYVDFHLMVPAAWTIAQGHDTMDVLETHILKRLDRPGTVLIHLDYPYGESHQPPAHLADGRFSTAAATRLVVPEAANVLTST